MTTLPSPAFCPACDTELTSLIKRKDKYTLLQCKNCSFITSSPLPSQEEIRRYYDGFLHNLPQEEHREKRDKALFKDVQKILRDLPPHKKELLDCGGGTGGYAQAFARAGFEVTLIDIDPQACAYVKEKYAGLFEVIEGDALQYPFTKKFDIIFCNQLIEHYPNPNLFLQEMKKILAPGGVCIITTPNQKTKEFYFRPKWFLSYIYMVTGFAMHRIPKAIAVFLKQPWLCCDPPRHLHALNQKNITLLLEKNYFNIVSLFTEYSTCQYYSPRKYSFSLRSGKGLITLPFTLSARMGTELLKTIDSKKKWGGNLVVYATKK